MISSCRAAYLYMLSGATLNWIREGIREAYRALALQAPSPYWGAPYWIIAPIF